MKATPENYKLRRQISLLLYVLENPNTSLRLYTEKDEESREWFDISPDSLNNHMGNVESIFPQEEFFPILGEVYEFGEPQWSNAWTSGTFYGYDDKGCYMFSDEDGELYAEEAIREKADPGLPEPEPEGPYPAPAPYEEWSKEKSSDLCLNVGLSLSWEYSSFCKNVLITL